MWIHFGTLLRLLYFGLSISCLSQLIHAIHNANHLRTIHDGIRVHENVIEYLLVLKPGLNECCRTCIVNIDQSLENPMIPVCRNALNVVKDDLIIRIDELGRFVYIYTLCHSLNIKTYMFRPVKIIYNYGNICRDVQVQGVVS